MDNMNATNASNIAQKLREIYSNEMNSFSFSVIMFGLGNEADFDSARNVMGIKPEMLAKLGTTAKELRKMIGFISSSVSSSAAGNSISAVTF